MKFSFFAIFENIMILLNSTFHDNMFIFLQGQKGKKERCCTGLWRSAQSHSLDYRTSRVDPTIDLYSDPPRLRIPLCGGPLQLLWLYKQNPTWQHKLKMASSGHVLAMASLFLVVLFFQASTAKPATFFEDFHITWAESHIKQLENGTSIQLLLDPSSGTKFIFSPSFSSSISHTHRRTQMREVIFVL